MQFTISLGWWLVPLGITIALFAGWRLHGVKQQPNNGGMFPDFMGGIVEGIGYLVAALLAVIVWLIFFLIGG